MELKKWSGRYPSAARYLMEEGMTYDRPSQTLDRWTWTGGTSERITITYKLIGMNPANFQKYRDSLLLLAYQEAMRYNEYRWKYARFEVKIGATKKYRKDIPEVNWFAAATDENAEVMVYGPGYAIEPDKTLAKKARDILDIAKRYLGKVSKQKPYRVLKLVICIRDTV